MKTTFPILLCLLCNCASPSQNLELHAPTLPDSLTIIEEEIPFDLEKHVQNYANLKAEISNEKDTLTDNTASRDRFQVLLADSIFPYWYGTEWDFNGHTEEPRNGQVACGYFVSTTLRDMGMNINRYKIAQKASEDIVKTFCKYSDIKRYRTVKDALSFMDGLKDGEMCIVGLSYHVGFLMRKNEMNYFIHSSYVGPAAVEKEIAENSSVLAGSDVYVIGQLNGSDDFMKMWLDKN